jgi:hypothetical protein
MEELAQVPPAGGVRSIGPEQEDQLVARDPIGSQRQVRKELVHLLAGEVPVPAVQVQFRPAEEPHRVETHGTL